jgi:CheY-like chemotaxis protein
MKKTFGHIKILCVEDDMFLSSLIGKKLGELGATLFSADSGEKALEISRNEKPDIILLDILLPGGMDGFQILEKIKADESTKEIKVIILSNLSQKIDIEKGKRLGAARFLVKATVDLDEIVGEIKDVLKENK